MQPCLKPGPSPGPLFVMPAAVSAEAVSSAAAVAPLALEAAVGFCPHQLRNDAVHLWEGGEELRAG